MKLTFNGTKHTALERTGITGRTGISAIMFKYIYEATTMYVGNKESKTKLIQWLKEFYTSRQKKTPNYAVLHGPPGNGKTYLVEYLAKIMKLNIHKVTPDDNIKDFLKTINICKLDDLHTKKIILIDSLDDFSNTYIHNIDIVCKYPIIYTSIKYPPESLRNGLILSIKKPFTTELFDYLKIKQKELNFNYSDSLLLQIAEQSPSVRSAVNSLYTGIPQQTIYPDTNILTIKKSLVSRSLKQDIDIPLLHALTKNGIFSNNLQVLKQFADYDVLLRIKYKQSIDNYLVNNMLPPIETLKWYNEQKKPKKQVKEIKQKKQKPPVTKTYNTIDNYF